MIRCSTCDGEWTGLSRAHCTSCHQTFNSVSAFDKHRKNFGCLEPEQVGLVRNKDGYWGRPLSKDRAEQLATLANR